MSTLEAIRAALEHMQAARALLSPLVNGKRGPLDSFTTCATKADDAVGEAHIWLEGALELGERPLIVQHEAGRAIAAVESWLAGESS